MDSNKIAEKVFKNSLETCEYIGGYANANSSIRVRCIIHDEEFETKWDNVRRDNRAHHICPQCKEEDKNNRFEDDRESVECAYCGEYFYKPKSKLNSKSGLYFCCREHKDLSQRIESGEDFEALRPAHYGLGLKNYRAVAFRAYEHKCACCGWNEDERILEVHHIDENHNNNAVSNLAILCPTCHRKITLGYYFYDKENQILISK
jgi:Zn ribbon nucleic-acid-binding protein